MTPIWKDRVWFSLVLGPVLWVVFASRIAGWSIDGAAGFAQYALGLCLSVAVVSIFMRLLRGDAGLRSQPE